VFNSDRGHAGTLIFRRPQLPPKVSAQRVEEAITWMLTKPDYLQSGQAADLAEVQTACPELAAAAGLRGVPVPPCTGSICPRAGRMAVMQAMFDQRAASWWMPMA